MGKHKRYFLSALLAIAQTAKALTLKQVISLFLLASFILFPMLAPFYTAQANTQKDDSLASELVAQHNQADEPATQLVSQHNEVNEVDEPVTQLASFPTKAFQPHSVDSNYWQRLTCEDVEQFATRFYELLSRALQRDDLKVALSQEQQAASSDTTVATTVSSVDASSSPLANAIMQHEQRIARGQNGLMRIIANWVKWEEALGTPNERRGILSELARCTHGLSSSSVTQCSFEDVTHLVSAFHQQALPTDAAYRGLHNICEIRNAYWQNTASQRLAANGIEFAPSFLYRGTGCYYDNSVSMVLAPDGASVSFIFHDFEAAIFSPEECRIRVPIMVDGGPERNAIKFEINTYYSGMLYGGATSRVATSGTLTGNGMAASGSGSDVAFGFTVYPHKSGVVDTRVRGSLVRNESHTGVLETTTDAYVLSNSPSVLFPDYINPDSLEISGQTYTSDASYSIRFQGKTWLVTITALGAVLIHLVS